MLLFQTLLRVPYYLIASLLYIISLLPLKLLYTLSDLLFFFCYYLIPYRKEVVRNNLAKSFPDKSTEERKKIGKIFYRHLADLFFESLKGVGISESNMKKRVLIQNPECMKEALAGDKGILLLSSHYANFEWMSNRVGAFLKEEELDGKSACGMYQPFNNKAVDMIARKYRGRWGWKLIPTSSNITGIYRLLKRGEILGIFMDQRPPKEKCTFYTLFLQQLTPFYTSVAKLGLATEANIIYVDVEKKSRGNYSLTFIKVDTANFIDRSEASVFALTDVLAGILEKILLRDPAYWLWTHKRWKHKMAEGDSMSERAKREFSIHLP